MTALYRLREAGQAALGEEPVEAADVVEDPAGDPILELTVWGGAIPPAVLSTLAAFGCGVDPAATATRGDPTHTIVVARQV